MLDAAMQETFAELAQRGSGVEPEDVVRAPAPRRGQDQSRAAEQRPRDPDTGQFVPTRSERRQSSQDDVDPYSVLSDQDESDEATERRSPRRERTSVPAADEDDDDELYEPADESNRRADARRRRVADEDEEEDDSLDPEGDYDLEDADDEVDDEEPRARTRARSEDADDDEDERPRRQSRPKRFSKRVEREIARQVQRQVGTVLQQNQQMAQEQAKRAQVDQKLGSFMTQVLGTPERHRQLEQIAFNEKLPDAQRRAAYNDLKTYRRNHEYFENYRAASEAVNAANAAADMKAAVQAASELRPLDPKVIAEGNVAKTMLHAYAVGRALGQQEADKEIRRLKKLLGNARGSRDERDVRSAGGTRRSGQLASAGGRRANGRIGQPDPLRGAFESVRGVKSNSKFAVPTEETLDALKRGELTFEKMGLGRLRV